MSVIEGVLKEELERLKSNISSYETMLKSIPRGSIFVQHIKNNNYVYRKKRIKGKIISEYIGIEGSIKGKIAIEDAKEYKRIKNNIRIAKTEFKKLSKINRIYG